MARLMRVEIPNPVILFLDLFSQIDVRNAQFYPSILAALPYIQLQVENRTSSTMHN